MNQPMKPTTKRPGLTKSMQKRLEALGASREEQLQRSITCTCGDVFDEHGFESKYPGSTACQVKGCGCIAFEAGGAPRR